MTVRVPDAGHFLAAAVASIDGRRAESFVEFGQRPTAEEEGVRVRQRANGEKVIMIEAGR